MENSVKFSNDKHASAPTDYSSNSSKYSAASVTHPSMRCSRSRDYLQTILKKINSGENVLSRIPTRLDPNIQFSDDEDDESPPRKPPSPERRRDCVTIGKENKANVAVEAVLSHRKPVAVDRLPAASQNHPPKWTSGVPGSSDGSKHPKTLSAPKSYLHPKCGLKPPVQSQASTHRKSNTLEAQSIYQHMNKLQGYNYGTPSHLSTYPKVSAGEAHSVAQSVSKPQASNDVIMVNGKAYTLLSLLGSGGSCKVYSVIDMENKTRVAIKRVNLRDADPLIREGYMKEIQYLQKLQDSDRVIKMHDFEIKETELLLVLEHGDIDFAKYISNEAKLKRLTPLMIKFFWAQMLEAVADIHKYGIVHSDLKPANFLLVAGQLKLIDFGIATSVPDDMTSTFRDTQVGTLNYMSPEAITHTMSGDSHPRFKVGVKSDVWSLGCILYNLVYGATPFHAFKALMQKIAAMTDPNYTIPFPPLPDPLLLDVLKSCLRRDPKERASVEELLRHPYLSKDNSSAAKVTASNSQLDSVLAQMKNLTPRRMKKISEVVQELTANNGS